MQRSWQFVGIGEASSRTSQRMGILMPEPCEIITPRLQRCELSSTVDWISREGPVFELADPVAVVGDNVAVATQLVLVGGKAFDPHRAPCVQFAVADSYFGAEAVTVAVRKTCRGIVENAGRIDFLQKTLRGLPIFRDNTFGVF